MTGLKVNFVPLSIIE